MNDSTPMSTTAPTWKRSVPCTIFLILPFVFGCVKYEKPEAEIRLIDLVPISWTTLSCSAYDLRSPLVEPFLMHPGPSSAYSNIVVPGRDVKFVLFSRIYFPRRIIVEAANKNPGEEGTAVHVILNDTDMGFFILKETPRRKTFFIREKDWNFPVNALRFHIDGIGSPVEIRQVWVDSKKENEEDELLPGNRFCHVVLIPSEESWETAVLLPAHESVSFPVLLPEPGTYFHGWVMFMGVNKCVVRCRVITARPFQRELPLEKRYEFPGDGVEWEEMEWDISRRHGRYAVFEVSNLSDEDIFIKEATIRNWRMKKTFTDRWI